MAYFKPGLNLPMSGSSAGHSLQLDQVEQGNDKAKTKNDCLRVANLVNYCPRTEAENMSKGNREVVIAIVSQAVRFLAHQVTILTLGLSKALLSDRSGDLPKQLYTSLSAHPPFDMVPPDEVNCPCGANHEALGPLLVWNKSPRDVLIGVTRDAESREVRISSYMIS